MRLDKLPKNVASKVNISVKPTLDEFFPEWQRMTIVERFVFTFKLFFLV